MTALSVSSAHTNPKTEKRLQDFQQYLISRNMSSNTVCVYSFAVRQFFHFYSQLSPEHLQLHKVYLLEHYKPQTVNLRIRALNCYMEYLGADTRPLPMIRVQQKMFLEKIISQADYEYLKRRLWEDENMTFYFIVRYITATGVRVSELIRFTTEDVYAGIKDIYSKGNKMRRIYIPTALQKKTLEWLKEERRRHGALFLNRFGLPISTSGIRVQLKHLAARYNLEPELVYPHSFRHRFAKNFIEACGDIALLSDLLGHESIETTRIYLRRSSSEQYQIINKVVDW